jgi:hypothetical protein
MHGNSPTKANGYVASNGTIQSTEHVVMRPHHSLLLAGIICVGQRLQRSHWLHNHCVRFEVFTAVRMMLFFWVLAPLASTDESTQRQASTTSLHSSRHLPTSLHSARYLLRVYTAPGI